MPSVLITGAARRVGRDIAMVLAQAGYDLVLHGFRSADQLEALADEVRREGRLATTYLADLSDAREVDSLSWRINQAHPALDAIVHNASVFARAKYGDITRTELNYFIAVNLSAPFFLTQALLPSLRATESPAVVHLTDVAVDRVMEEYAHYTVSKAGLLALTRALAVELAPHVRVNAVSPGTVALPDGFDQESWESIRNRIPLRRAGCERDVANAVLFLIRDAGYITGHALAVDGGRNSWL
jgi:pteridine reductase